MDDDLIQCELEQDREGTYSPDNSSQNDFIDHVDNTYTTDKRKDQFTIHMENQIINDNEETTLKCIVQNEAIRTDDNKHISEESEANDSTTATKLKKTRKKQTLDIDQQLAACKARISMLEEQNQEYENTINLLHKRLRQEAISDKVENTQNTKVCDISCMNDIKMRIQKLEESVESKFTIINIEFRHKLEYHETKTKHDLETMRLKTETDRLRQQENRNHSCEIRTHAQKNSKCSASCDQQLPVTTITPQVLRHDTSVPVPTLPPQVQQHDTSVLVPTLPPQVQQHDTDCAQPQVSVPTLPPQVQRYDKNIQPPQYHSISRPMPINVYNQLPNMPIFRVSKVLPSQQPVTHIQTALS
jgi:hypothetical protein